MLEIVYQDEQLVAINKPHGLLVHRSKMANDAQEFALQILRNQLGRHVYPVHRLDRKTGGVLLFALDKEYEISMQKAFQDSAVKKEYLAIVRGHTADTMDIDYPLAKDNGTLQEAFTSFTTLQRTETPWSVGQHPSSRYSLVLACPTTGRMHQLRKHFAHIFHPIIGDRPHGCNKQNRFFKANFQLDTMLLHAYSLCFEHPYKQQQIRITANLQAEFVRAMQLMNLSLPANFLNTIKPDA